MTEHEPLIKRPHMCLECRAGKAYIGSENVTKEAELRLRMRFKCGRCGWTDERRGDFQ